ncbi:MAG: nucleotidyltransferase substrate binding protein [Bdellovibrionales bacterium]|nr:nucleotidyltransferase substrate binding protein [Bdellovibrionales bacterium]
MKNHSEVLQELKIELIQSLEYLEYSFKKIHDKKIPIHSKNPEDLETYEALVSRFSRVTDIFISKYLRTVALNDDPAYSGALKDWVNYAEKKGVISSASTWMQIRELRNKIAHEYATRDLAQIFTQVIEHTPFVLDLKRHIS